MRWCTLPLLLLLSCLQGCIQVVHSESTRANIHKATHYQSHHLVQEAVSFHSYSVCQTLYRWRQERVGLHWLDNHSTQATHDILFPCMGLVTRAPRWCSKSTKVVRALQSTTRHVDSSHVSVLSRVRDLPDCLTVNGITKRFNRECILKSLGTGLESWVKVWCCIGGYWRPRHDANIVW
jgi:hypothetical protein